MNNIKFTYKLILSIISILATFLIVFYLETVSGNSTKALDNSNEAKKEVLIFKKEIQNIEYNIKQDVKNLKLNIKKDVKNLKDEVDKNSIRSKSILTKVDTIAQGISFIQGYMSNEINKKNNKIITSP